MTLRIRRPRESAHRADTITPAPHQPRLHPVTPHIPSTTWSAERTHHTHWSDAQRPRCLQQVTRASAGGLGTRAHKAEGGEAADSQRLPQRCAHRGQHWRCCSQEAVGLGRWHEAPSAVTAIHVRILDGAVLVCHAAAQLDVMGR